MEPISIAMISDFFHPAVGGVENHIYMLSANLIRKGHKVIVITHSHSPDWIGILYYIPFLPIASSATLPNFLTSLPYLRTILLREHIHLIHAHASLSSIGHEAILHSHLMGIRTVFTDHKSIFLLIYAIYCSRENTVLRGQLFERSENDPNILEVRRNLYVIPNALVAEQFKPCVQPSTDTSIDLLVATAPKICARFPNDNFVVGGDGPKLIDLLQMREKYLLQDRIELLGPIRHKDVISVLSRGSIFMNTSLTEAFGIAILEAACAGLYVVSTRVGGVPEILPEDMISFAEPDEEDVIRAISEAVDIVERGKHDPFQVHERIKTFYNWEEVTSRTEKQMDLMERIQRTMDLGPFAGPIYTTILLWMPREDLHFVYHHWNQVVFAEV
ncbi:UDP-Glycosyltransferase/glycogen phosphorylase [Phlegmacium glaucopus]|nr:UDP-Glycosyltransferase/glycogen phosphorylase [Phlegmacium glaucopus]